MSNSLVCKARTIGMIERDSDCTRKRKEDPGIHAIEPPPLLLRSPTLWYLFPEVNEKFAMSYQAAILEDHTPIALSMTIDQIA